jgi:hypothetical protein
MLLASTSPIVTAAISAGAGFSGVVVGGLLTWWRERSAQRDAAVRDLNVAALRCLARLHKLEDAKGKRRANERYLLGGDLDAYIVAIAGVHDQDCRGTHWANYKEAAPLLDEWGQETPEALKTAIRSFEQVLVELTAESRDEPSVGERLRRKRMRLPWSSSTSCSRSSPGRRSPSRPE